jgi:hypothetical protein
MDFDYKQAWIELACPAFGNLPFELRQLFKRVADECGDLHQEPGSLRQMWPATPDLRQAFEAWGSTDLAKAARAVNNYGHWVSGERPNDLPRDGSHWKFAHYCDQVLSERLGVGSTRWSNRDKKGLDIQIHDGFLRCCYSSSTQWTWTEVGLANENNVAWLKENMRSHNEFWQYKRYLGLNDPWARPWLLAGKNFVVPKTDDDRLLLDLRSVPAPEGWRVQTMTQVNHRLREGVTPSPRTRSFAEASKPHPFCIGTKHMERSDGGYLNPRSAPCDICGEDYDDHLSDKAVMLACSAPNFVMDQTHLDNVKPWLLALKEKAVGVEGFGFVPDNDEE